MIRKIQQTLISKINAYPTFKKKFLKMWDGYHYFWPFVVGYFTRIFPYIKHVLNSKVIAQSGSLGFKGGVFNPGACLLDKDNILIIAKAQFLPWYKARGNNRKFYLEGNPVIFLLDSKSLRIKESHVLNNLIGFPKSEEFALEDFRLFEWKGQKMLNHSFIIKGNVDGFINQTSVKSALSVLDEENKITFSVFPKLDFPIQNFEKNWVYKENGEQLLLFYSLNPYRVLVLEKEEDFTFKTIINQNLTSKVSNPGNFGTMVSFSTNPIDFDDQYWFLVIHQIKHKITGRCYYHWGILIDKFTFLPVKITLKPIFSGMGARGRLPGIRYISSILKIDNEILFFAGEGDVYVTVTRKTIEELNGLFVEI